MRVGQHRGSARLVQTGNMGKRLNVGVVSGIFGSRQLVRDGGRTGNRIGTGQRRAKSVGFGKGNGLDGDLALDTRVLRHHNGAVAARAGFAKQAISVEYELAFGHAACPFC